MGGNEIVDRALHAGLTGEKCFPARTGRLVQIEVQIPSPRCP